MPLNRVPEFTYDLTELIGQGRRRSGIDPIYLGGVPGPAGGTGTPPGGFIGQLVQTKVAYDITESDSSLTSGSSSLLDNLNHVRARINTTIKLWNRDIVGRDLGDVVVQDKTQTNSFKTTTTANDTTFIGVVRESISAGSLGYVSVLGYVGALNVNGPTNIGDYLYTSTTAGKAAPNSSGSKAGLIGIALSSGSIQVSAIIRPTGDVGSSVLSGGGISGRIAEWTGAAALGSSTLIKTGAGVLTLSASGAFTETVPGTGTASLMDFNNQGRLGIGVSPAHDLHAYLSSGSSGKALFGSGEKGASVYDTKVEANPTSWMVGSPITTSAVLGVFGEYLSSGSFQNYSGMVVSPTLQSLSKTGLVYQGILVRPLGHTGAGGAVASQAGIQILSAGVGNENIGLLIGDSYPGGVIDYAAYFNSSRNSYLGTGNVGIGVLPSKKLHVDSLSAGTSGVRLDNQNVINGSVGSVFTSGSGPTGANINIQGWLKINVGGTDRFMPFW